MDTVTNWGDAVLRLAGFAPPDREPDHVCATDPQMSVKTIARIPGAV